MEPTAAPVSAVHRDAVHVISRSNPRALLDSSAGGVTVLFITSASILARRLRSIKHLPRIQNPVRVERAAQFAHHAHLGVAGEFREKTFLCQADAVFASDRATEAD